MYLLQFSKDFALILHLLLQLKVVSITTNEENDFFDINVE